MREIKFRAWDKINNLMLTPFINLHQRGFSNYADWDSEYELMQYTGLKDKNGKEIYEGDIINLINADGESINVVCEFGTARRVIFENTVDITGFYFKLANGKKTFPIVYNYAGKHDLELFEVIGNTHENPELIGGGQDG